MSMISFRVVPDHGDPYEVHATSRDIYLWEKTSHGKAFSALMEKLAMVDLYELAWTASRRQGLFGGTLNDFTTSCEISFETEDDESADPFPLDRSPEPVSSSPAPPASRRASGRKKASGR